MIAVFTLPKYFSESTTDQGEIESVPSEVSFEVSQDDEIQILKQKLKLSEIEVSKKEAELREVQQAAASMKESLEAKIHSLQLELRISRFGLERFSSNEADIKFFTSFSSYDVFCKFFNQVKPSAEKMVYVYASGIGRPNRTMPANRPAGRKMLLIDELFMFCMRLRVGLFEQDLAQRFHLHISSVSRKLITWANFLYFFLGHQPIWCR